MMEKIRIWIALGCGILCLGIGFALGIAQSHRPASGEPDMAEVKEIVVAHLNEEHDRSADDSDFLFETLDARKDGTVGVTGIRRSHFAARDLTHAPILIDRFWVEVSSAGSPDEWNAKTIVFHLDTDMSDVFMKK